MLAERFGWRMVKLDKIYTVAAIMSKPPARSTRRQGQRAAGGLWRRR